MMNEKELPVYAALDRMGIEYTRIEHPAAATMEACAAIGEGTGASHCKNLFLTNRQGTAFFLVMLGSSKKFRTASVSKQLGVARLSFTTAEQLENILGLTQGSVTVTGLLNDTAHCVHVAIDRDLLNEERILIHPNINTASLVVKTSDILRFLDLLGYEFTPIAVEDADAAVQSDSLFLLQKTAVQSIIEYAEFCGIQVAFVKAPCMRTRKKGRTRSESGFRSCKKLNRLKRIF